MGSKLHGYLLLITMTMLVYGQNITQPELTSKQPEPKLQPELELVPNYDNVDHRVKAFTIRQPLVLHCNITKEGDFQLIWEKQGVKVSEVDQLNGRYEIIEPENKFIVERTLETDAGHYSCSINTTKKEFRVVADVAVRTPDNIGASEGEHVSIPCTVVGSLPKLYWKVRNETIYESTEKYILEKSADGVENAVLRIENVTASDRGEYRCFARNILTDLNITEAAMDVTMVRVKDIWALVWPSIGICAELVILCITTCIFSRLDKGVVLDEDDE